MKIGISLSAGPRLKIPGLKAVDVKKLREQGLQNRLPPLDTFLSKESIQLLKKWHETGGKSSKLFSVENFQKIREEFQAAGLWKPPTTGNLYRGVNLTAKTFADFMLNGILPAESEIVSWTTLPTIAADYAKGTTSGSNTFGVVFKTPVSSARILADLRRSQAQSQGESSGEQEVILHGYPLSSTSIDKVFVPVKSKARMIEIMKVLNKLKEENLFVGTPDPSVSEYNVDAFGRLVANSK